MSDKIYSDNGKLIRGVFMKQGTLVDSNDRPIQPEFFTLSKLKWTYFISLRPDNPNGELSQKSHKGRSRRESFWRTFVYKLRRAFNLNSKDFKWVGTSEGEAVDGNPHMHGLVKLTQRGKRKVGPNFNSVAESVLAEMKETKDKERVGGDSFETVDARIDRVSDSQKDRERVSSYFCKRDGARREKDFWFPSK